MIIFVSIILISSCNINKNKILFDSKANKEILIGQCNRKAFKNDNFKSWYNEAYNDYKPDETQIEKLKKSTKLNHADILVIFGTWCHDSRRELPHFYKIVDEVGSPKFNIKLIGVDTKKSSQEKSIDNIEFTRIPTFIFYENGKEIGRIVESVKLSLESDILEIISK